LTDYGLAVATTYPPTYEKDPSDTTDYSMSWHFLGTDTISTSTWASDGLTIGVSTIDGLVTNVFISGGTAGVIHNLTNTITSGMGRTLQRTVYIAVKEL
jgi:hypothetical protein